MFSKKIVLQFLMVTFGIAIVCWGTCIVCAQFGILLSNNWWMNIPYIIGAGSPAISSFLVLKWNREILGFSNWIRNIFTVKRPIWMYLFTIGLCALYYVAMICIGGIGQMKPIYMLIVLTPLMFIGGGHEEAGWRYILQPSLDKKFGFVLSALIVGVTWALWHLPLFFIPGVGQYGTSFLIFTIYVIGLTFALGAIRKITDSVFLCVLFHSLFNAASTVINPNKTLLGSTVATVLLVIVSLISVLKKSRQQCTQNEHNVWLS